MLLLRKPSLLYVGVPKMLMKSSSVDAVDQYPLFCATGTILHHDRPDIAFTVFSAMIDAYVTVVNLLRADKCYSVNPRCLTISRKGAGMHHMKPKNQIEYHGCLRVRIGA